MNKVTKRLNAKDHTMYKKMLQVTFAAGSLVVNVCELDITLCVNNQTKMIAGLTLWQSDMNFNTVCSIQALLCNITILWPFFFPFIWFLLDPAFSKPAEGTYLTSDRWPGRVTDDTHDESTGLRETEFNWMVLF